MGIYGKFTTAVLVFSYIQIFAGVSMIGMGIAFRLLVCSWVTDASFGFWVGALVFLGGIIGHCSTTRDNYSLIGIYLSFNSFSIMLATLVIFCHSLATVHFQHQLHSTIPNPTNSTNSTNATNVSVTTSLNTTASSSGSQQPKLRRRRRDAGTTPSKNWSNGNVNNTLSTLMPSSTYTTTVNKSVNNSGPTGPRCYADQTWSNPENGLRGISLGASMIFLCFVEIIMSILSSACCWATTKIQPTRVRQKKVTIQGTVSEMMSTRSHEMVMLRRRGERVTTRTFNIYEDGFLNVSPEVNGREASVHENHYETIPTFSPAPVPDEPIRNWYSSSV